MKLQFDNKKRLAELCRHEGGSDNRLHGHQLQRQYDILIRKAGHPSLKLGVLGDEYKTSDFLSHAFRVFRQKPSQSCCSIVTIILCSLASGFCPLVCN
jgi:hypothetical protein